MAIRHVRIACWTPRATNTHSEYVIMIAFPRERWLHERPSMLSYTYTASFVIKKNKTLETTLNICIHSYSTTCFGRLCRPLSGRITTT